MVTEAPDSLVVTGVRYLQLATTLLQRMRVARPTGGVWEAADVQWWWRQDRATDRDGQLFWLDTAGEPIAAVIRTDFGYGTDQCDVLVLPGGPSLAQAVWQTAISWADAIGSPAEFPVPPADTAGISALAAAGYGPADDPGVIACWLDAAARPPVPRLPAGYRLRSRAEAGQRSHPMIRRNGPDAEARLRTCSLYRPELDLMVEAPDGQVAGYGLFWADNVTRVGLVEPMRTEDEHQRLGIASHILAEGLDRLAARGCSRLKVSNDLNIYLRAGFVPLTEARAAIYARSATAGHGRL
jgi:GNAT superfamily N-acetyltransferase